LLRRRRLYGTRVSLGVLWAGLWLGKVLGTPHKSIASDHRQTEDVDTNEAITAMLMYTGS